jgi:hypothetical protein
MVAVIPGAFLSKLALEELKPGTVQAAGVNHAE